jgi:uncharacterized membrane protein YraQ (UPF0718 family)
VISISAGYPGMLAGFIGFFSLTLLALLDFRRGFLFAEYPVRTFFYVFTPWHAPMLGVLLSGLALTVLPVYLTSYVTRGGFTGSVFGAMFALPQPFCSCCSSAMAPSFVRRGASTTFLLSFIIGAPMLNLTTMLLALTLLPAPFAITRIGSGLVMPAVHDAAWRSAPAIPGCRAAFGRGDDRRDCGGSAVPLGKY